MRTWKRPPRPNRSSSTSRSLLSERDQFKDIALRLQADFENYRRRMSAQRGEEIDQATGRVVEGLLPVLDACEAAFAHGADQVEPVWSALIGALQKQGLEALDLQDKPFDPSVAEAVAHEPGSDPTFRRACCRRDACGLDIGGRGVCCVRRWFGRGGDLAVSGTAGPVRHTPRRCPPSAGHRLAGAPATRPPSDRTWRPVLQIEHFGGGE